ncbi:MAG: enoyl-CoA hydratase/isomerase family protein [Bordetella sp.]|nr:enoyl-CoA hydratase/isomerase family protein [Bordetella sp.]
MDELLIESHGLTRVLTLNRPAKRNALNRTLTTALLDALAAAEDDGQVHVVVVTGMGPSFCAGADVGEFKDLTPDQAHLVDERAELTMQLHLAISRMTKPVIAAVNGPAMGGGAGLAIACDLVLMGASATLGYPEIKRGIVAAIVLSNLTKQVGRKAAFHLVATGEAVSAERSVELGMANTVCADDRLLDEALELARKLASFSREAMSATKRTFHEVADMSLTDGLQVGKETNRRMRGFKRAHA